MRGTPLIGRLAFGLFKPQLPRLGVDVSGIVEAVGSQVTRFKCGDAVFGACRGAFAQYACGAEAALALKPANITFAQAGAVGVAALTALQGLRNKAQLKPGQRVLVNGAAGGVGTFAVQIAKAFGASVTGVCSTVNVPLVRSLGADRAVDYTRENFTTDPTRYDVIFDAIGNHTFGALRRVLQPKGICLMVGAPGGRWIAPLPSMIKTLVSSLVVSQRFVSYIGVIRHDDLMLMANLMAAGKVTSIIDRQYALPEVPQAIAYLEQGHARGKVVVNVLDADRCE